MKYTVRLKTEEFMKAAIEKGYYTDTQVAKAIGVSASQVCRAKLPVGHPQHNSPGPAFIAGVLTEFGGPFERFFFIEKSDARSQQKCGLKGGQNHGHQKAAGGTN